MLQVDGKANSLRMKILSIQTGQQKVISLLGTGEDLPTGIYKLPIQGDSIHLGALGLEGDTHVHKSVHGGEGRALFAFSAKNYDFWRAYLAADLLKPGVFGENLTMDDLDESQIAAGDIFSLGECFVQATMPRLPCVIFASRVGRPDAQELLHDSGRPGVLFRVLQTGKIRIGDELQRKEVANPRVSIREFFDMLRGRRISKANAERLLAAPALPENFRSRIPELIKD